MMINNSNFIHFKTKSDLLSFIFIHFGFIVKYFRNHNKKNGNKNIEDSFKIYIYIRPVATSNDTESTN